MSFIKKSPAGNDSRLRRNNPVGGCPLTAALAAIGGKWKLIIVYWLAESPKHFAALRSCLPGISQKVLTQQLRELVNDGIVRPLVEDILQWGRAHMKRLTSPTDAPLNGS
jgi:DNA-binding HxlR family transcriptional regulator